MKFRYVLEEAIQALRSNALRSALTIIGIVVGIFSVTAMLALGEGLSGNILERFNSFTSGDITVSGEVTQADLAWVKSQPYVAASLVTRSLPNVTAIAFGSSFSPTVEVALGDYTAVKGLPLVSGTGFDFTDAAFNDAVVIIDERLVESVEEETGQDISTGSITLGGQKFTVIGVVESSTGGFGRRGDGSIIVPYASSIGVLTNDTLFSSMGVSLVESDYYEVAGKHILEALNTSRGGAKDSEDYFSVSSAKEAIETAQETTSMISLFLGLVGGIALFVGGIGTMNMMLTTVTERTKEIGLRKAIGARDRDIMFQILAESIMLTTIGGAIGIALSYAGSLIADTVLAEDSVISVVMSGSVVAYATIVAIVVGIVFGIYPARNASKLQPVDALRAE
jgi:ABC-type antimicrobial peptide transport system permease subunit